MNNRDEVSRVFFPAENIPASDESTRRFPLRGIVKDQSTNSILVNVVIIVAETGLVIRTSRKGNFFIKSLPARTYTLTFTKLGYQIKQQTINLKAGERADLIINMQPFA